MHVQIKNTYCFGNFDYSGFHLSRERPIRPLFFYFTMESLILVLDFIGHVAPEIDFKCNNNQNAEILDNVDDFFVITIVFQKKLQIHQQLRLISNILKNQS